MVSVSRVSCKKIRLKLEYIYLDKTFFPFVFSMCISSLAHSSPLRAVWREVKSIIRIKGLGLRHAFIYFICYTYFFLILTYLVKINY